MEVHLLREEPDENLRELRSGKPSPRCKSLQAPFVGHCNDMQRCATILYIVVIKLISRGQYMFIHEWHAHPCTGVFCNLLVQPYDCMWCWKLSAYIGSVHWRVMRISRWTSPWRGTAPEDILIMRNRVDHARQQAGKMRPWDRKDWMSWMPAIT